MAYTTAYIQEKIWLLPPLMHAEAGMCGLGTNRNMELMLMMPVLMMINNRA